MFCTYLTLYSGDKLPPLYIGSTSVARIGKGYRESVLSKEFSAIWGEELKSNPDAFETIILSEHKTRLEAFEKEQEIHIALDVVNSPLYANKAIALQRFNMAGHKHSEEARMKMSAAHIGRKHSEETKQKMSKLRKDLLKKTPMSDETRKKLSVYSKNRTPEHLAKIGAASKNRSPETLAKISAYHRNRPLEVQARINESNRGKIVSEETRAKLSVAGKGRPKSDEWKAKISAIAQAKKFAKAALALSNEVE